MSKLDQFEILFIDDETEISNSYLENFTREGFNTIVFNQPKEAVEYINLNFNKIVLIFTDQNMPGLSGTQLSDFLVDEAKEIPMVMVSGYLDVDLIDEQIYLIHP